MKALIADAFPERYISAIKALGVEVEYKPKLKAEELGAALDDASMLIVRSTEVPGSCISSAKNLSLIIRAGAGVNTIDMKAANAAGVFVTNCPGKNAIAVAELTMALLLAIDRRIADNVADLRSGKWNKGEYSKADGVFGKTFGVIGTGQIGFEVIHRARAFGLNVIAWSRSLDQKKADQLRVGFVESVGKLVSLSDIISVHVALKPETRGLISRTIIEMMKPGTIFLNTSRAEIVDEVALAEAAEAGKVRVGTDVFVGEPEDKSGPFESRLGRSAGVVGTHHIGASTEQAQNAVAAEVVNIIDTYLHQGIVLNWVNRQKKTVASCQLVVRHLDRPGVLANVLAELKSSGINVEEVENVIFDGGQTACCTMRLNARPSESTLAAINARTDEVIQTHVTMLS